MKYITKLKLAAVHQLCDVEDRSTEYTFQVMMDIVKVDISSVTNYFELGEEVHARLFREMSEITQVIIDAESSIPRI